VNESAENVNKRDSKRNTPSILNALKNMIKYLPGWTYVSKRGVRVTLMSNDGERVEHCRNDRSTALAISETSLKNFQAWTDPKRTLRLHRQVAHSMAHKRFIRRDNAAYVVDLIASTP
jgi:hypothetical protein